MYGAKEKNLSVTKRGFRTLRRRGQSPPSNGIDFRVSPKPNSYEICVRVARSDG